jgi:DnaJ-class molecular chaperone
MLRWHALRRASHPDAGGDPEEFMRLKEAATHLLDPTSRAAYDKRLRFTRKPCDACDGTGVTWRYQSFQVKHPSQCRFCKGIGYE